MEALQGPPRIRSRLSREGVNLAVLLGACLLSAAIVTWSIESWAEDQSALLEAVRAYFEAEMSGDTVKVWELLAPSSAFKMAYSYPFYVEMVRKSSVRVKGYTIEEVLEVHDNPDTANMPSVEKIAVVKVRVVLGGGEAKDYHHTGVFTFLLERRTWYKG